MKVITKRRQIKRKSDKLEYVNRIIIIIIYK